VARLFTRPEYDSSLGDRDMDERDGDLGLDAEITRRDFIDGVARIVGTAVAASAAGPAVASLSAGAADVSPRTAGTDYPPLRQGMRGFNPEAMTAGHAVRDGKAPGTGTATGETYDLVVVGAGMAGLSAAYFYRKQVPNAKILILEACDDLGGHARRVEFNVGGRQLISNGGTVGLWYPNTFSPESRQLLRDIGVDEERYYGYVKAARNPDKELGLTPGLFFNSETYGIDRLVPGRPSHHTGTRQEWSAYLSRTPMSNGARDGLLRLFTGKKDHMPGVPTDEKVRRLRKMTYVDYLTKVAGIHPDAVAFVQAWAGGDWTSQAAGPDTFSAWFAWRLGLWGFDGMALPEASQASTLTQEPGQHIFFPDGNGSVARLLVRWLIPEALPGTTMEDSIPATLRYDRLDLPDNGVRIRLSSAAVRVKHLGDPVSAREVEVTYVREGQGYRVRAGAVVLACFNAIVPHLMPELPEEQKAALHQAVRKPLVYTRVALRNWRAFHQLGVSYVLCPGMFYKLIALPSAEGFDGPSEWGDAYRSPAVPDDPVIITMEIANSIIEVSGSGLPPREQWKAARARLEAISFETMERNIRSQLDRVLGPGGFSARRDIAGITVSRWCHGYSGGTNELYDPDWSHRTDAPWIIGRRRFGRVAISNSDAAAVSLTNASFAQSHRAVMEIVNDVVRPVYDFNFSERDTVGPMGAYPDQSR
jgi:spermidine dehydrogenase